MTELTKTFAVDEARLACAMGSGSLRVLATPAVIAMMENTAARLADSLLADDTLTTVGTAISVEHTAPTPLGAVVTVTARLRAREGRCFHFDLAASDPKGEIAHGTHTRVSVTAEKFQQKTDGKLDEV